MQFLIKRVPDWALRIKRWAAVRFPVANALLLGLVFLAQLEWYRAEATPNPAVYCATDLLLFAAYWSYFLLLRIIDEHKDFDADRLYYPDRPVQSGIVSLYDLRVLGVVAITLQIIIFFIVAPTISQVLIVWSFLIFWTALMSKQFFIPQWTEKHPFADALLHLLTMPLTVVWLWTLADGQIVFTNNTFVLLVISYLSGVFFEVVRKWFAPEEKFNPRCSYSTILGMKGSAIVTGFCVIALIALSQHLVMQTPATLKRSVEIGSIYVLGGLAIIAIVRYQRLSNLKAKKVNLLTCFVFLLGFYISLISSAA